MDVPAQPHIVEDGEGEKQPDILKTAPDAEGADLVRGAVVNGPPLEGDAPPVGL